MVLYRHRDMFSLLCSILIVPCLTTYSTTHWNLLIYRRSSLSLQLSPLKFRVSNSLIVLYTSHTHTPPLASSFARTIFNLALPPTYRSPTFLRIRYSKYPHPYLFSQQAISIPSPTSRLGIYIDSCIFFRCMHCCLFAFYTYE
ncbi:hypothetical protein C8Q75DRAFT_627475 [Abortiporus biennis]|nr:hypothetical protein C8Q75DRAFT_627475 [Abortiporus biennis]